MRAQIITNVFPGLAACVDSMNSQHEAIYSIALVGKRADLLSISLKYASAPA